MATQQQIDWAHKIFNAAQGLEISPIFTTAQACLESGWGKSAIGNNIFGVTKGSWTRKTQLVTTTEYFAISNKKFTPPEQVIKIIHQGNSRYKYTVKRLFRDYDTLKEALEDHESLFKKKGYIDAWPYRKNPEEFAKRICDNLNSKYATSPSYLKFLLTMIRQIRTYSQSWPK